MQEKVVKVLKNPAIIVPNDRKASLLSATTVHEVEHLTAVYKSSGKRTYAERAKELGLNDPAMEVLQGVNNKFVS